MAIKYTLHLLIEIFSKNCLIQEINGVSYFIAGRKVLNIDRVVICRILTNLLGFEVSQRRLKSTLPFFVKLANTTSWCNQCLCSKCTNCEFSVDFLNKLGRASDDALLKILDLDGLIEIVSCENTDKRLCLANLQRKKCFLHGASNSKECKGKITENHVLSKIITKSLPI